MDEKDKKVWENLQFPTIKNIKPKLAADDIKGFDPNNPKDVEEWGQIMKDMYDRIKVDFDKKGIPMPRVVIDSTPGPARPPEIREDV